MNVKIAIAGIPKDKEVHKIRTIIDNLLDEQFQSFKFNWEVNKELIEQ
jgi:hypothetical protein